jgi:hypothetical protein
MGTDEVSDDQANSTKRPALVVRLAHLLIATAAGANHHRRADRDRCRDCDQNDRR